MKMQPWASAPRDGTWILPYTGHKHCDGCGYDAPQKWDAKAGVWIGDDGVQTDDLDDCAKGYFALPSDPTIIFESKTISRDAFNALCKILRMRESPSREAARLVLVEGLSGVEAAFIKGITPAGVSYAVTLMRAGLALAKIASKPRLRLTLKSI